MISIHPMAAEHSSGILTIVEGLPEWFDEVARTKSIPIDIRNQEGFVALVGPQMCGFITLYVSEGRLHIGWLAVERGLQRQGVGSRLLDTAVTKARAMGISELATYTLGDSVDYAPYEVTRKFYRKYGFDVYKRAMTDNPGCPEEIWISKRIS